MLCMQVVVLKCKFYFGSDAVSGQKLGKSKGLADATTEFGGPQTLLVRKESRLIGSSVVPREIISLSAPLVLQK